MSNAFNEPVKKKISERAEASEISVMKSELKKMHFLIAELKEMVKMALDAPQRD